MSIIKITNDTELFHVLNIIKAEEWKEDDTIEFSNYPNFEIIVRGKNYHGGVPVRIMPALIDLQKLIDREFANAKYGDRKKHLTKDDKEKTELVVSFEDGHSTKFFTELAPYFNEIFLRLADKMDGTQAVITILGVAGFITVGFSWKVYLNHMGREKDMDTKIILSNDEVKKYEILKDAVSKNTSKEVENFQQSFLKKLSDDDKIIIDGEEVVSGEDAKQIIKAPRLHAIESRLDGTFKILSVDSGLVKGGFRVKVINIASQEELSLSIPEGTLSEEQIEILKNGEWGKLPVTMQINIRKIGNRVTQATLIETGLSQPKT